MRTTVDIPDELLRVAKERAGAQGCTLSQLVELALQAHLEAEATSGAFKLLVRGTSSGSYPSPTRVHELLESEERGEV